MGVSEWWANQVVDAQTGNGSVPAITPYIALYRGSPGDTGANEISGGGYVRQPLIAPAASGKQSSNSVLIRFPSVPGNDDIDYFGLCDAETGGHYVRGTAFATPKHQNDGDPFEFAIDAITLSEG